ncbi:MAG TPA: FKBP-type peptidyl-prolyl cis-trans isomerase [Candidatus Lumbricidophila sp.]|nr:FKBP-type peptidyl-prolyl cis-trans isomerase [Candidatus Lumbricidophila sp.]
MKHRKLAAPALALIALGALAGCSAASGPAPSTKPVAGECSNAAPGSASDSVKLEGALGTAPKATFATPLTAKRIETSVATKGSGAATKPGDTVGVLLTLFNGKDGKQITSQQAQAKIADASNAEVFRRAIDCQPIGTRTVTVAPASEVFGAEGNSSLGIAATDTVVVVVDISEAPKAAELPKVSEWTENVPTVKFDGTNAPVVTVPKAPAATDVVEKVLEAGTGATVAAGDTVTVRYQGLDWATGTVFDQSYPKDPISFATDQVVPGFGAALIGQKVGSKVIVSIPPAYAYGTDPAKHQLGGKTLVFVIEIVATKAK